MCIKSHILESANVVIIFELNIYKFTLEISIAFRGVINENNNQKMSKQLL